MDNVGGFFQSQDQLLVINESNNFNVLSSTNSSDAFKYKFNENESKIQWKWKRVGSWRIWEIWTQPVQE